MKESESYIPALRIHALTRLYDPVVARSTRERAFKLALLENLAPRSGQRILDLGCGTGTLALMIKRHEPDAQVVGLDADEAILDLARRKSRSAGLAIDLQRGSALELPFEDGSFDAVTTSLFFHHLEHAAKEQVLDEVKRVLKPVGRLHVADWGAPTDPAMSLASISIRVLDGFSPTADNFAGRLPDLVGAAGFADVTEGPRFRTIFGSIAVFSATKAPVGEEPPRVSVNLVNPTRSVKMKAASTATLRLPR